MMMPIPMSGYARIMDGHGLVEFDNGYLQAAVGADSPVCLPMASGARIAEAHARRTEPTPGFVLVYAGTSNSSQTSHLILLVYRPVNTRSSIKIPIT
jgi:hypothetical protein